jgi:hypothetical protein
VQFAPGIEFAATEGVIKARVLTLPKSTTWLDVFPGLSGEVIAKLRVRGIRSVSGAVRAARQASDRGLPISHAIPRMRLDGVLDREAAHLFLMLQLAADMPAGTTARKSRRRPTDC